MFEKCCGSRGRGPKQPWEEIDSSPESLVEQMLELYWIGVQVELNNIILTLNAWLEGPLSTVSIPGETEDSIDGYDTFIDQVCEAPRVLADLHCT